MKEIKPNISESLEKAGVTKDNYLSNDGVLVLNFADLRQKIAELSCLHPDSVLFFRGQHTDYKRPYGKKGEASTFLPSIYRGNLKTGELLERWNRLELATALLVDKLKTLPNSDKKEFKFLKAKRLAKWSVLQHYEVVNTPLLDVTQSLRVACSFAELNRQADYAYIYVFALPYPSGRITINSEHYLTNIRLLNVVPSMVKRPHNQEGFLLGEDDMVISDKVSDLYDFRRRAIAKFKIHLGDGSHFWEFNGLKDRPLSESELYPDKGPDTDILAKICEEIKNSIETYAPKLSNSVDKTGHFLFLWRKIESYLLGYQREMRHDLRPTVPKSLLTMRNSNKEIEDKDVDILIDDLYELRTQRNKLVHVGWKVVNIEKMIYSANSIIERLEHKIPGIK